VTNPLTVGDLTDERIAEIIAFADEPSNGSEPSAFEATRLAREVQRRRAADVPAEPEIVMPPDFKMGPVDPMEK